MSIDRLAGAAPLLILAPARRDEDAMTARPARAACGRRDFAVAVNVVVEVKRCARRLAMVTRRRSQIVLLKLAI
jgi:hypothetical protein